MTYAYDEIYLGQARNVLAGMFDYAMLHFDCGLTEFYQWFLVSEYAKRFQDGDCSIVAGRSGAELACDVYYAVFHRYPDNLRNQIDDPDDTVHEGNPETGMWSFGKNPYYWTGWALAYYQWFSSSSFEMINRTVPIDDVVKMYSVYHEMDILQFCDEMNRRMNAVEKGSRLKQLRRLRGYSQRILAEKSGVPIRTIQQYEQGQKDIQKAQTITLIRMSKVLGCTVEDICG